MHGEVHIASVELRGRDSTLILRAVNTPAKPTTDSVRREQLRPRESRPPKAGSRGSGQPLKQRLESEDDTRQTLPYRFTADGNRKLSIRHCDDFSVLTREREDGLCLEDFA